MGEDGRSRLRQALRAGEGAHLRPDGYGGVRVEGIATQPVPFIREGRVAGNRPLGASGKMGCRSLYAL